MYGAPALPVDGMGRGSGFDATARGGREGATMIPGSSIWIAWPLVAAAVVLWQMRRRARWPQLLGALALVTYAWWICSVAFFPLPLGDSTAGAGEFAGRDWVNLVPFREMFRALPQLGAGQIVREFGGNVLLFVAVHPVRTVPLAAVAHVVVAARRRAGRLAGDRTDPIRPVGRRRPPVPADRRRRRHP